MVSFILTPATFFERRLYRRPNWWLALSGLALCVGLQAIASFMFSAKAQAVVAPVVARLGVSAASPPRGLFAAFSAAGYPMAFALAVVALVCLDVLTSDSHKAGRLVEFTGFCFYTHVPYCVALLGIAAVWRPEPIALAHTASTQDVVAALARYGAAASSGPLLSTARILSYYSMAWLVFMMSLALRAVARLSVWGTAGVCALLVAGIAIVGAGSALFGGVL